jgi:hypothetical protein
MRWWRRRTLAKAEAQRLLDGGSVDSPVAELLRAAAGPARPAELAGERAAVAAFRREYGGGTRPAAAGPVRRARRPVAVLAAALTVGVLAGTGVAAGAGRLPAPLQRAAHDWIGQVPDHEPEQTAGEPQRSDAARTPAAPTATATTGDPAATADPAHPTHTTGHDVRKLCKEWEKARDDPQRKPMDPDDLRALTAAAGGADRIEGYCGLTPTGSPTPRPGNPSKKPGRP